MELRATIIQQKTGQPAAFEITEPTRDALAAYVNLTIGEREGHYQISTDWFDMTCRSDTFRITLD